MGVTDKEKVKLMEATVEPVIKLIEKRLENNMDALDAITPLSIVPTEIPDMIQKMREEEAARIRILIKEQRELLSIIKIMFPHG